MSSPPCCAPCNISVSWEVKIYRNKYLVGWTQGICTASDGSCGGM
ncbi:hypothetical protein [Nocardia niigatensis]